MTVQQEATQRRLRVAVIVALVLATVVGYADRQVLALLKPVLDRQLGWSAAQYGAISATFQIAMAFGLLLAGWIVDRAGPRLALGAGLVGWSLFATAHALARTVPAFIVLRAGLGIFEAVGTPASMAAVTALFPRGLRGRVIGVLNAVPNAAAMLTPILVGLLFPWLGWTGTVAAIGVSGLVLAAFWFGLPLGGLQTGEPRSVSPRTAAAPAAGWRPVAAFALGKTLTDPVWWFMLYWLPDLLHRRFGLDTAHLPLPLVAIYAAAAAGSLMAGLWPARLVRNGMEPEAARRRMQIIAAFAVMPLPLCLLPVAGLLATVALVGLALFGHQAFATSLFSFVSERIPAGRVGRVAGIGAFCGNAAGAAALWGASRLLGGPGGLLPILLYAASAYAIAACVFALLVPVRDLRSR
ncbi:MFS transporter [Acetobacteraceae bacterium KSS8]|uniref:MFS transporter n=1 Tax=Endosaccharibacter trunci TaxID=2812733 RepID=A0ABT1W8E4_9PROT|nr:MFS transporter [Acetobacteraceae bacterium KSS8]